MRMPLLLGLYGLLSKKRLKAALLHLDFAYGEHIDQGQKYEILKKSLVHFLGMPFVWIRSLYWTEAEYLSMVKVSDESTKHLQAALAQGKGILLMLPWSASGVFMAATLGVETLSYAPWAVMNYTGFLFALLLGATGWGIAPKIRDDETVPGS